METSSEEQTIAAAAAFSRGLTCGDVVALHGDLGAGKSVFCRAVIRALCGDEALEVPSPTFTLVQVYDYAGGEIWHFDLYRLSAPEEIYETGWEEALAGGIALVEWPERLGGLLPVRRIDVTLAEVTGHPEKRVIEIIRHEHDETR